MDEKTKQVIKYKAPYELVKGHETDSEAQGGFRDGRNRCN